MPFAFDEFEALVSKLGEHRFPLGRMQDLRRRREAESPNSQVNAAGTSRGSESDGVERKLGEYVELIIGVSQPVPESHDGLFVGLGLHFFCPNGLVQLMPRVHECGDGIGRWQTRIHSPQRAASQESRQQHREESVKMAEDTGC